MSQDCDYWANVEDVGNKTWPLTKSLSPKMSQNCSFREKMCLAE
jgi:hypothetical protein